MLHADKRAKQHPARIIRCLDGRAQSALRGRTPDTGPASLTRESIRVTFGRAQADAERAGTDRIVERAAGA